VRAEPNWAALGKRLGKAMGAVASHLKAMSPADVAAFEASSSMTVAGHELSASDVTIVRSFNAGSLTGELDSACEADVLVILHLEMDDGLLTAGLAREAVAHVQKARKAAGLVASEAVSVRLASADAGLRAALEAQSEYVRKALGCSPSVAEERAGGEERARAGAWVEEAELGGGRELEILLQRLTC
jgi:isoleucyl-tRNA synthetase